MNARTGITAVAALMLSVAPAMLSAQSAAQQAPDVRYLTVTRFEVPQGADRDKVMMWIDSIMVPLARHNPNVLSYQVAAHNWGANSNEVVLIAEYPSWGAIEAECEACDRWTAENQPKEGTPEARKWEEIGAVFGKYYGGHADEIYAVAGNRAKRR